MYHKMLSDNNINSNTFMLSAPGGRQVGSEGLSVLNLLETVNTKSLARLSQVLDRQPDCATIVKCDLMLLVQRATDWDLPWQDCNRELSCSLMS